MPSLEWSECQGMRNFMQKAKEGVIVSKRSTGKKEE